MSMTTGRRVRATVTLEARTLRKIDALAKKFGMNRSRTMEQLLEDQLEHTTAAARAFANPLVREAFFKAMTTPGISGAVAKSLKHELTAEQEQSLFLALESIAQS